MTNKFIWSEIFASFQGEVPSGEPSLFFRVFGCNLNCKGFGSADPTFYNNYISNIDFTEIKELKDLPIFEYGCDSIYSWDKRFRKFSHQNSVAEVAEMIIDEMNKSFNIDIINKKFLHSVTKQEPQIVITGGEPMLYQTQISKLIDYFYFQYRYLPKLTIETNGTIKLKDNLKSRLTTLGKNFNFSISPKLYTVSGQENAIDIETILDYNILGSWLKFVVDDSVKAWEELDNTVSILIDKGYDGDIYCTPVGSTKEQQIDNWVADFAMKCMSKGYKFCGRLHTYVFGNKIGT